MENSIANLNHCTTETPSDKRNSKETPIISKAKERANSNGAVASCGTVEANENVTVSKNAYGHNNVDDQEMANGYHQFDEVFEIEDTVMAADGDRANNKTAKDNGIVNSAKKAVASRRPAQKLSNVHEAHSKTWLSLPNAGIAKHTAKNPLSDGNIVNLTTNESRKKAKRPQPKKVDRIPPKDQQGRYKCGECDFATVYSCSLKKHLLSHRRTICCQFCARKFIDAKMLSIHMEVH